MTDPPSKKTPMKKQKRKREPYREEWKFSYEKVAHSRRVFLENLERRIKDKFQCLNFPYEILNLCLEYSPLYFFEEFEFDLEFFLPPTSLSLVLDVWKCEFDKSWNPVDWTFTTPYSTIAQRVEHSQDKRLVTWQEEDGDWFIIRDVNSQDNICTHRSADSVLLFGNGLEVLCMHGKPLSTFFRNVRHYEYNRASAHEWKLVKNDASPTWKKTMAFFG